MPVIGPVSGFDYTAKWGIDVGHPAPIQLGSRPPSQADWEAFPPEIRALFGLPDWETYQKYQQAYEGRSAQGGDIYQEKQRAAEILLRGQPQTWEQARQLLIQNGFDPSAQASGPLFKELEILWNGGEFAAGGHGAMVNYPGQGLSGIAGWLPGMGQGLAMQEWFRNGQSSMEGYDPATGTYWNRRTDGTIEFFDILGNRINNPGISPAAMAAGNRAGGGYGGMGGLGGLLGGGGGMGNYMNELAQQAHLDTLGQQFEYEKAAREYGQALPLEQFYKDMLGDILGVDFGNGPEFSLNQYFQRGMQGAGQGGGPGIDYPGLGPVMQYAYGDPNDPRLKKSPNYIPPPDAGGGGSEPPSPQPDAPLDQEPGLAAMAMGAADKPVRFEETPKAGRGEVGINLPEAPVRGFEIGADPLGMGGMPPAGGYPGGAAPMPTVPFPTLEGKGYAWKQGPALDLANQRTFGMLAPDINRMMADTDAMLERYKQEMPIGGERAAGVADILKGSQGDIYGLRQNLLQNALQGVAGLSGAKKGYNPAGYSGSGQALLGSADTRRGQDLQSNQFYSGQQHDINMFNLQSREAQKNRKNQGLLGLLGTIGTLGGALLSDERVKENVTPSERGLEEITELSNFDWRYAGDREFYSGPMAQDVERVMPEAVGEIAGLKFIKPMNLLAATMNAVKELQDKIERMQTRPKQKKGKR